jgi:hypothetical protein
MTETGTRTYEIVTSTGRRRITVPETYKVTFGAVVPGAKANGYSGGGWGLRIWESADKQRAVFSDVVSFRDLSIPVEVMAVRKFGDDDWFPDDGTAKAGTVERAWKSIDEVKDAPDDDTPRSVDDDDIPMLRGGPMTRKRY